MKGGLNNTNVVHVCQWAMRQRVCTVAELHIRVGWWALWEQSKKRGVSLEDTNFAATSHYQ